MRDNTFLSSFKVRIVQSTFQGLVLLGNQDASVNMFVSGCIQMHRIYIVSVGIAPESSLVPSLV